jgi:hypothetical protein
MKTLYEMLQNLEEDPLEENPLSLKEATSSLDAELWQDAIRF